VNLSDLYNKAKSFIGNAGQTYNNVVGNAGQSFNNANAVVQQMPSAMNDTFSMLSQKVQDFGGQANNFVQNSANYIGQGGLDRVTGKTNILPTLNNNAGFFNSPKMTVAKGAYNLGASVVNAIGTEGIIKPVNDLSQGIADFSMGNNVDRNTFKSGAFRLGADIAGGGQNAQTVLADSAQTIMPILNAWGGGKVLSAFEGNAIKDVLAGKFGQDLQKKAFQQMVINSTKQGAKVGGSIGVAQGLQDNQGQSLGSDLLNSGISGVAGGVLGAGLGMATPYAGRGLSRMLADYKAKMNPNVTKVVTANISGEQMTLPQLEEHLAQVNQDNYVGQYSQQEVKDWAKKLFDKAEKKVVEMTQPFQPQNAVGKFIQNPQAGMSIKDVSKETTGTALPVENRTGMGDNLGMPKVDLPQAGQQGFGKELPIQKTGSRVIPSIGSSVDNKGVSYQNSTPGQSVLQGNTNRVIKLSNGKTVMINGQEGALSGSTARITRKGNKLTGVQLENQGVPTHTPIEGTPGLPAGPTNEQLLLGTNKSLELPQGKMQAPTTTIPSGPTIPLTQESRLLNPETAKQEVVAGLQTKFDNFEKGIYGNTTSELQGGTKGGTRFQNLVRPVRDAANKKIEQGLSSENGLIRNISRGIRGLMGGAGNTAERTVMQGQMKGGVDTSRNLANDFQALGDKMLPDKLSREKVWAHLDPELSGVKVGMEHLTTEEQKAVEVLRTASDLINDQNFALGRISHETWLQGRNGKYITRAYSEYDLPPELSDAFVKGRGKLDLGQFKQRTDVNGWKQENAIKDPFYLASKRIQSTFSNKAITDYGNWVSKQANMVSDVAKNGYTQLSDSPMWGDLAGKNVRHDVLEGIKGFYSDNKALQGMYDALNAYDRWAPRQILKKTKTVYNPATRLGNQISNRVFAIFNGINPISFEKNMQTFAKKELADNGQYARLLRKHGVLGTDMTKYELVQNLAGTDGKVGTLGKIDNKVASSYGAVDDRAKISAFKYWLDQGKTIKEAVHKVASGFQDYSKVGQFYDIGAKLPIVGKPFIRFQSELARIIKNSALENPFRIPLVVGSIALIGEMASKASGETAQDKQTRENRFGTPVVPFTNVPLVFQTPIGEVNVARMFGMYETAGADTTNRNLIQRASKYLPIDVPLNKADALKMASNDVLTGGITSLITDTDFRGKSIADPNQNQYKASNLTPLEQNINRAKYLGYNYNLPVINSAIGVGQAIAGKPNQYDQTKTPTQAISAMSGFKINQFGPKEASDQRIKDQQFDQYKKDDVKKNINSILKEQQAGKIDATTAKARIENQQSLLTPTSQPVGSLKLSGARAQASSYSDKIVENPSGGFSYIDSNGDFKTAKTRQLAERVLQKEDLLASDKNSMKVNGGYLRKSESGDTATFMSDNKYNETKYAGQLTSLKKNEDYTGWMDTAQKQMDTFIAQMKDPNADEVDNQALQNKLDTLTAEYAKYNVYKGFTQPKAGKKAVKLATKFTYTPKKLSLPKFTSPKISSTKLPSLKQFTAKKLNLAKLTYKPSYASVQGVKRLA